MSDSKRSKKRSNVPNTPKDHFISAYAHHIEEAVVHLHAASLLKGEVPTKERQIIVKIKRHLAVLHRLETKRHRDPDARD